MSELSVNISQAERSRIVSKAIELIYRTASAKHPDVEFRKNITSKIINYNLSLLDDHLDSPLIPLISYVPSQTFSREVSYIRLPNDLRILELKTPDSHNISDHSLFERYNNLDQMQFEELNVSEKYMHDRKVMYPFTSFDNKSIKVPDDLLAEIEEYNLKMEEEYINLGTQLHTLLNTIARCKTTKAFYSSLPDLTSLFPGSLQRKIVAKNTKEPEQLTDEQQALVDATTSIATANLIGE